MNAIIKHELFWYVIRDNKTKQPVFSTTDKNYCNSMLSTCGECYISIEAYQ
jgi:hypothetical protein